MTPVRLIQLILRDAGVTGVGETARAEDNNDVLDTLNMMLDEWSTKRWLVYHLVNATALVTGAESYTIGPGGDFDTVRPDQVQAAFYRSTLTPTAPVDYVLRDIGSREDYNRIAIKNTGNWPSWYWYDAAYPLGVFYPWPLPTAGAGELHLSLKQPLSHFPDLTTDIAMPPAYVNALRWCGAQRVRPMYQLADSPQINGLARAALMAIRGPNMQVPIMRMPLGVQTPGSRYSIFSDGYS
jgi:hypothetical protein